MVHERESPTATTELPTMLTWFTLLGFELATQPWLSKAGLSTIAIFYIGLPLLCRAQLVKKMIKSMNR